MAYSIYIPTKGRADIITTSKLLDTENISYKLVIEPQDVKSYKEFFTDEKLVILPKNNVGVSGVRTFIKSYSQELGEEYHWQIDDNIKGFKRRIGNKNVEWSGRENIEEIEKYVDEHENIGQAGMIHHMFAWGRNKDYNYNQQVVSCVLFNNKIKSNWREGVIDDTDFSLQVLSEGFTTIVFNRLVMNKSAIKTMKGGCTDLYYNDDNVRHNRQKRLQDLWPGWFDIHIVNGTSRVKPSRIWRTFKQRPVKKNSIKHKKFFNIV